ncbi:hypothetical protein PFICI_07625 [Pestalotiopsis fici W106-1]|uniref:2EXR domain-containing protein n=1 Tax=Pestalotiopsis fici (strain W106-1 / CGMCC3.15140) TaxID=1229662 RepID=W3X4J2_PESFW|nr:uncharacterized protein PFICI_07625 [Pestalotiopsis fici W106-1]ETS80096.1 hypothetical protein PFICI_07625 [Pestalotiopsis fici W106-1]
MELTSPTQDTMSQTMAPSFSKFNDLPPELRIKIWQTAMPEARTVVVKSPYAPKDDAPPSLEEALVHTDGPTKTWTSNTPIPALLHVNAEARHEASKRYQLALSVGQHQPRIYVDFTRDTIFLGSSELKPECSSLWSKTNDMEKIERLAVVPEGAWRVLRWKKIDFDRLQKLTFVHDTEKLKLGPTMELVEDKAQDEAEELVERIEQAQRLPEPEATEAPLENEMKQRMQAARDELETLMMVLPTTWEKEPIISTAVFA